MDVTALIAAFERAYRTPEALKLLKPIWRERNQRPGTPPSRGFCYIASEAAFHMMGGTDAGWRPMRAGWDEDGEAVDHWWLLRKNEVLDVSATQFTDIGEPLPYDRGKPKNFMTKEPSQRAVALRAIVERFLNAPPITESPKPRTEAHGMAVKINRTEFLQSLARVEAGLSPRAFIDQSDCYVFDQGWVSSFNDEICCRAKSGLPADFTGAVHAKPLKDALGAMTADEVKIDFSGKRLEISAGRERIGIRMEREIVLPVDEVTSPERWEVLPSDFSSAIDKVIDAAGTNDEEFLSVCVHIHPDWVEATDRKQMCRYRIATGVTDSFLVRAKSVAHMIKLDVTKVGQTDEWVHFRNKSVIFSCRRHVENYFDLSGVFDFRGEPAKLPRGGDHAATLAGTFCEGKDNDKVLVSLKPGKMTVRGEGSYGYGECDLDMEYDGEDLTFRLAPQMLTKLVKETVDCELDGSKLCVRGDKWTYLTVLGRPTTADVPVGTDGEPVDDEPEDQDGD